MKIVDILRKMKQDGYTNEQILEYLGHRVVEAGIATGDSTWMKSLDGSRRGIVLIERTE